MTSPFEIVQKVRIVVLIGMVWVLALLTPLMLGGIFLRATKQPFTTCDKLTVTLNESSRNTGSA